MNIPYAGPMPPRGKEISLAFLKNTNALVPRFREQIEASRHGEANPNLAASFDRILKKIIEEPDEWAVFFLATPSAATETVEQFLQTPPSSQ